MVQIDQDLARHQGPGNPNGLLQGFDGRISCACRSCSQLSGRPHCCQRRSTTAKQLAKKHCIPSSCSLRLSPDFSAWDVLWRSTGKTYKTYLPQRKDGRRMMPIKAAPRTSHMQDALSVRKSLKRETPAQGRDSGLWCTKDCEKRSLRGFESGQDDAGPSSGVLRPPCHGPPGAQAAPLQPGCVVAQGESRKAQYEAGCCFLVLLQLKISSTSTIGLDVQVYFQHCQGFCRVHGVLEVFFSCGRFPAKGLVGAGRADGSLAKHLVIWSMPEGPLLSNIWRRAWPAERFR